MTPLLEKTIAELNKLPEAQQETMAQWILDELEDDARWDQAFSNSLPQLEKLVKKPLKIIMPGTPGNLTRMNWNELAH